MWRGGRWGDLKQPGLKLEWSNYFCISTFKPSEDPKDYGQPRRRKALHHATFVIVFDDVGPKVPWENVKLSPSYVLETSPANHQVGFKLTAPETDAAKVERLIDGLIFHGLASDNKDPGMRGVTRFVRLPLGTNTKAKYAPGFACQLKEWHPERAYTCEEIAAVHGISLAPPSHNAPARPRLAITDEARRELAEHMLAALEAEGRIIGEDPNAPGKWHVRCPWLEDHTSQDDSGTAYFEPGYVDRSTGSASEQGGFKCHHGHCEGKHLSDVVFWLQERGHHAVMHPRVAAEFQDVVVAQERLPADKWNALHRDDNNNVLAAKVANQEIILFHDSGIRRSLRFNTFTQKPEFPLYPEGRTLDAWVADVQGEIERVYGVTLSAENIRLRLHKLLEIVSYDPLKEWARETAKAWDGQPRTRRMLIEHAGAIEQPAEYVEAVTWSFMLGAAHRALTPGSKFDHMLILEGKTGIGKSTLVRMLSPRADWHAAGILNVDHKDGVADLLGKFLYEMEELQTFRRAKDWDALKAFLSRVSDRARLSYRRDSVDYARRTVFIGTTEKRKYLPNDGDTAQRRFWPVQCSGRIELDWYAANNEQIWAEPLHAASEGETPMLGSAVAKMVSEQQLERAQSVRDDPWCQALVRLWEDPECKYRWPERATSSDVLSMLGVSTDKQDKAKEMRAAEVLKALGYKRDRLMVDGKRDWYWVRWRDDELLS